MVAKPEIGSLYRLKQWSSFWCPKQKKYFSIKKNDIILLLVYEDRVTIAKGHNYPHLHIQILHENRVLHLDSSVIFDMLFEEIETL